MSELNAWRCKTCTAWWIAGPAVEGKPSRCYGDCGGTEFDLMPVECNTAGERCATPTITTTGEPDWRTRALAAEARVVELEKALREACDTAEEGWSYAGDYFNDKHESQPRIDALRSLLADGQQLKAGD